MNITIIASATTMSKERKNKNKKLWTNMEISWTEVGKDIQT